MAAQKFNTPQNQTIAREKLALYMNTGDSAETPVWSPVGIRVADSSMELDWQRDSSKDIMGNSYSSMKKPTITQSFDPWPLTNGDAAQQRVWDKAIYEQDPQALANMDMLVVHLYAGTAETAVFAERYDACAVEVTSLGGEGGGDMAMPITVTFGGKRTVGTAKVDSGTVTFSAGGAGV